MKRKRLLSLALTLVMLATALSGCNKKEETSAVTTEKTTDKTTEEVSETSNTAEGYQTTYGSKDFDNVTITVEVFDRSNAPDGSTVIDNKWVDYINEQMNKVGITVEFAAVPRSEEVQKVQTMMASGTAADIMICYTKSIVEGFYNDGGTYDLAPYIDGEDQALNIKNYIGEDCLDVARNSDGALWAVAARRSSTAKAETFIRKDWLDALDMEIPTTVDELYDYLYACKYENPSGSTDVIASSFNDGEQMIAATALAFCESVSDEKQWSILGGNVSTLVYGDDGMAEYYRWLNKLYNDGLIDPEYYAHEDFGQTLKENIVSGKMASFEMDTNYQIDATRGGLLQNLQQNNQDADIISIAPMKNVNDGQVYNSLYAMNGVYVFIPKTCSNVEAAITYLDWLSTDDGGYVLYNGFEGEHYTVEEGLLTVIDPDYNASDKDWTRNDLFLVGNGGFFFSLEDYIQNEVLSYPDYADYVYANYENGNAGIKRHDPTFSGAIWTEKSPNIGLVVKEYLVKCITCAPDKFDDTMAKFREELKSSGIEEVIAERQEYYDALYK